MKTSFENGLFNKSKECYKELKKVKYKVKLETTLSTMKNFRSLK